MKVLKPLIILFAVFFAGLWLYNKYDERIFLRYGILKIDRYPQSMKMLDYKTEGASDFHAEYNITIDSKDFDKLLIGRHYIKEEAYNAITLRMPYEEPRGFSPKYRYRSGTMADGIAVIYVNADKTKAFIDYWVD